MHAYRDKWVNYVELSKRCDFNPASSYFFWFLDNDRMQSAIVDHLYQAMYNLKIRYAIYYAGLPFYFTCILIRI
jgi:hypothetical protein